MIAENGQGVGGDGPCSHMDDAGQQLPCHAVEIGQHEQQALGSGESGGKGSGQQRPMHGSSGAGFRLHLGDGHRAAVYVFPPVSSPFIA